MSSLLGVSVPVTAALPVAAAIFSAAAAAFSWSSSFKLTHKGCKVQLPHAPRCISLPCACTAHVVHASSYTLHFNACCDATFCREEIPVDEGQLVILRVTRYKPAAGSSEHLAAGTRPDDSAPDGTALADGKAVDALGTPLDAEETLDRLSKLQLAPMQQAFIP